MNNQIIPQSVEITASELGAKFQSKREVYRFLASECKVYVDHYEAMTIW